MDQMPLGTEVGLGPGNIVPDGDPAPPNKRHSTPTWRSMSILAKRLDGSRCHLVRRYTSAQLTLYYMGRLAPRTGHSSPPLFGPCLLWPNGRRSQLMLSSCFKFYAFWPGWPPRVRLKKGQPPPPPLPLIYYYFSTAFIYPLRYKFVIISNMAATGILNFWKIAHSNIWER